MAKYIVSDEHKFIYFVVQKVACTSIKNALLPLFDIDPTGPEVVVREGIPRLTIHGLFGASAYQIDKKQLLERLEADEYADYFKFAFVRNPWDRLVSCYHDKLGKNGSGMKLPDHVDVELYPGMPFAEFVEAIREIPDREANVHFRSQHKVVCSRGRDGEVMADFVGRFENLEADFAIVAQRIGAPELRLPHIVPHVQRSGDREPSTDSHSNGAPSDNRGSRPYTDFYDDRLKKLVHERYRRDIGLFGYSFSPASSDSTLKPVQRLREKLRTNRLT